MKRGIIAIALLATACGQESAGEAVMRTEIGSGKADERMAKPAPTATPQVVSACRKVSFEDAAFTHCIADPAKHRIAMDLGPGNGAPFRSLANLAAARPASGAPVAFAVNGGMFDDDGKPIGYYVENGNRLKTLNRAQGSGNFHMSPNGVFFGTGDRWEVRTSDDFYDAVGDRPEFGTQSGPMLLIAGKLHPEFTENGPSRTRRNGVGVDSAGRAHFVISEGAVSFGMLARFYRDELKVANALYLDGTVSSLWDPATERLDVRAPIGPMIVVTER